MDTGIWRYLPTWRQVRWWVLGGIIWAVFSAPVLVCALLREAIRLYLGAAMTYLLVFMPTTRASSLITTVWPEASQGRQALVLTLLLAAVLGGVVGYILRAIIKIFFKR